MTVLEEPTVTGASLTGVMKKVKLVSHESEVSPPAPSSTSTPADAESRTLDSKSSLSPSCWKRMLPASRSAWVKVSYTPMSTQLVPLKRCSVPFHAPPLTPSKPRMV